MYPPMNNTTHPELVLHLDPALTSFLHPLFERGVGFPATVNLPIGQFMARELDLSVGDVETIQTIFLDSSPVDDIEASMVRDGAVLALSAAMPGLMGATMRRAGTYSSLRQSISHHEDESSDVNPEQGVITLKLFNHMLPSFAPKFLARGVLVTGKHANKLFSPLPDRVAQAAPKAVINGQTVDLGQYELSLPENKTVLLRIADPD